MQAGGGIGGPPPPSSGPTTTTSTTKQYTNPATGEMLDVQFIDGVAQREIPQGFNPVAEGFRGVSRIGDPERVLDPVDPTEIGLPEQPDPVDPVDPDPVDPAPTDPPEGTQVLEEGTPTPEITEASQLLDTAQESLA